jgi:structure-specific recognition protein 1
VQNRPAFELAYSEIGNTNLAGRNEVAVEMSLPIDSTDTGTNGHFGGARGKGKKAGAGKDQLVEMRFYIPGVTTRKETEGEDAGSDVAEEEKNAATIFYDTLIEKAEIGETAGDTIATFLDILHLTPRYVVITKYWARCDGCLQTFTNKPMQRSFRHRHVRGLIPTSRQDVRLQDPI